MRPRVYRFIALACIAAGFGGCMKMETQRTTLEHKPNVVRAEGAAGADENARIATAQEERGGGESGR